MIKSRSGRTTVRAVQLWYETASLCQSKSNESKTKKEVIRVKWKSENNRVISTADYLMRDDDDDEDVGNGNHRYWSILIVDMPIKARAHLFREMYSLSYGEIPRDEMR